MQIAGSSVLVTGGASGLGLAVVRGMASAGAFVTMLDLNTSMGSQAAGELGESVCFSPGDVNSEADVRAAVQIAGQAGPLRVLVHCAGRGGPVRVVERDGRPGSLETFESIVRLNLVGTFNVLRLAAAEMVKNEPVDGERGVCVLTASIAAYEGQIGQIPYASSKAGVVGMTLVAARDLASKLVRVATVAPGTFDTPLLARLSEDVRASLADAVPHPRRLGQPAEFASLVAHIVNNPMINGETVRLDGAIRMGPR